MAANREDPKIITALADLCKEHDVQCLIQIGAGDGYEASFIKNIIDCRAITIEANSIYSSCSPYIEFHHGIVIGASNSMANFFMHENAGLSGHFPRNDGKEKMVWAPQQSLEHFCAVHGGIKPDALIIDTEGSTMEVLEGCVKLLGDIKVIYAEVQNQEIRPGIRLVGEVDTFLTSHGMKKHEGSPSYDVGSQANMTWIR